MLAAYSPNPNCRRRRTSCSWSLAGLGVVLTTAYFVVAIRRVCQGATTDDALPDVDLDEWVAWTPLLALTVGLGLVPDGTALVG